ncbi:MAG: alginate export family protein [Psychroflexus sp.]|uniref:alginate export family protein n=1 Tax=Psychroflexus sp. S27 TaxID=1982757 RepID=UPI000C2AA1CE|nr:alginate export family protein [Psychroflexus sp. S27]PJX26946.1 hypothetical protein CAP47_02000 [Psychroflexus sp. S27]
MKNINLLFSLICFVSISVSYAQLTVDAELRPRYEYRHGYKTLFSDDVDASSFVSQRTRLNIDYQSEKLRIFLSPQDIRVWGDVPQLNTKDNNGFSLHQAWAEVFIDSSFTLKVGRQEIVYDDQRMFGSVGWAQQSRSHDAAMVKFKEKNTKLHLAAAFNQERESLTGNILTLNTYKSFQYIWANQTWNNFSGSFLFLNNGMQNIEANQYIEGVSYSQTAGFHLNFKNNNLKLSSNLYYQFGEDAFKNDIKAYLVSLEAKYKTNDEFSFRLGGELQSGNDNTLINDGENNAFQPFYGTNHKFNGFMDYYYVGNHANSVGLLDLYANVNYAFQPLTNFDLTAHQFFSAAELDGDSSKDLGLEIDFVFSHQLNKDVGLKLGYSHYLESTGTQVLKNNFDGNTNNWGWVMLTVNPEIFKFSFD